MRGHGAWIGGALLALLVAVVLWFASRSQPPIEAPPAPVPMEESAPAPVAAPPAPAPTLEEVPSIPAPEPATVAEDAPPDGDVHLEVLVKDPEGSPVAGAEVRLVRVWDFEPSAPFPGGTGTAPRKTDGTGTAVLGIGPKDLGKTGQASPTGEEPDAESDRGRLMLYAVRGDSAALLDNLDLPEFGKVRREMVLGPAGILEGTVRRRGDDMVAGALLDLGLHGPDRFHADLHARTDAGGRFRFPPVPLRHLSDLTWLRVHAPNAMARQVKLGPGHFRGFPVNIILDPLWSLRGRCVGPDGQPLAGISAKVPPNSSGEDPAKWRTVTGPDGKFVIEGLKDDFMDLHLDGEGVAHRVVERIRNAGKDEVDLGDLALGEGKSLRGVVLGDEGAPVAGALVILTAGLGGGQPVARVRTDEQGRFSFAVEDGMFSLSVHPGVMDDVDDEELWILDHDMHGSAAVRDRVRPGPEELRIFLGGLRARFRFVDASTKEPASLRSVRVELYPVGGSTGSEDAWTTGRSAQEPAPLEILITTRKPGTYEFRATAEGHEVEHPPTVLVTLEREAVVDMLVRRK